MTTKQVDIVGIGPVTLIKSRQNRRMRLSISCGHIRLSMPQYVPFSSAIRFALSNRDWIAEQVSSQPVANYAQGQAVGKKHRLRFETALSGQRLTTRVTSTELVVRMLLGEDISDNQVRLRTEQAIERTLKRESEELLPPRLLALSQKYNLPFASVSVRSLKRRWGSCDSKQHITLNLHLMELPWEQIDYVLLHELTHTVHMNHGTDFWQLLMTILPDARQISKQLRSFQPGSASQYA